MISDALTIAVQILGSAGLLAGGYLIFKDVVDYKLKIADKVETRLEHVENDLEKCEQRCGKLLNLLKEHNISSEGLL